MISSYNQSNRIHAILITRLKTPTLKFVLPCLQYLSRIQCAIFNSCMSMKKKWIEIESFYFVAVITTSQVPPFLKQISTMSDTILLFKEDKNPVVILKDVSTMIRLSIEFRCHLEWLNFS